MSKQHLIFVDIGNSRIKFAVAADADIESAIAKPENWTIESQSPASFSLPKSDERSDWFICSVNEAACEKLVKLIEKEKRGSIRVLRQHEIPLQTDLETPETTGIDRLCAATAANRLRKPDHAAIVVDSGTAVTIDAVSPGGIFLGGVIFPGIDSSLKSLGRNTSALPEIEITIALDAKQVIGKNTVDAILGGVYWSHIGAIESIVARMTAQLDSPVEVFVTGGGGNEDCLAHANWSWHPNLVLEGVAISAATF